MVMGILNATPDSFYDGGSYITESEILNRCETILSEGAGIIDLGAVSTRPGSMEVTGEEELERLDKALASIRKHYPDVFISLDTYRADVAEKMVAGYGVNIINDISAGTLDEKMFETVAGLDIPYILMHIQGTPQTMQENPVYDDLMTDVIRFFSDAVFRLRTLGVKDIIIDPGFGFGKTVEHNYELLARMKELEIFECPLLAGVSRKSMIYHFLRTDAAHALNGTSIVNTLSLLNGADILRVHDVKEAVECVKIVEMYQKGINKD
ncbi:MAG: dihydropteroate synthase [Bacteroidales bacterium]|nr:dihydropteroate synthase [Bacteroidales bacterium]